MATNEIYQRLFETIQGVVKGQAVAIRWLLAALVSGGHVLLEDSPGTGKTTLAKVVAGSLGLDFKRIQFTPDLLPSDILGVSILDPMQQVFRFHPGPIFANLILADEINRASPRTQAALLEAMAERQVTIEGCSYPLDHPFFVVATQNPVDYQGTYPLPEAQLDRFSLKFGLGFVPQLEEVEILANQVTVHPIEQVGVCVSLEEIERVRRQVQQVRVSASLKRYIVDLVAATRAREEIQLGASPRGAIALMKVAQSLAYFDGYSFVTPDHVQEIAVPVLAHRVVMSPQADLARLSARDCIEQIVQQVPIPV